MICCRIYKYAAPLALMERNIFYNSCECAINLRMGKDIEKIGNLSDAVTLAQQTLDGLIAVLAGLAASEKKEWALSVGHLMQRARAGYFLKGLLQEVRTYREKGEIKDDYFSTEQGMNCMQEILEFLDKDSPDEVRFKAMRTLFLKVATEKMSNRADIIPVQLMRIARGLSSGEVLVLLANYTLYLSEGFRRDRNHQDYKNASMWLRFVAKESGLADFELVETFERPLMEKLLLSSRTYSDRSGIQQTEFYRLTPLGFRLCEYMSEGGSGNPKA